MKGSCSTPSVLFTLEEVLCGLNGIEVADHQPICPKCGLPLRRNPKRHEQWRCVCRYWIVFEFLWEPYE